MRRAQDDVLGHPSIKLSTHVGTQRRYVFSSRPGSLGPIARRSDHDQFARGGVHALRDLEGLIWHCGRFHRRAESLAMTTRSTPLAQYEPR
jgi:hypothetical protein